MRTITTKQPLTDAEIDRLADFLKSCKGGRAMNVEALDGFFAALITGPETVMPGERAMPLRLREEIQEMLRRGDGELNLQPRIFLYFECQSVTVERDLDTVEV